MLCQDDFLPGGGGGQLQKLVLPPVRWHRGRVLLGAGPMSKQITGGKR